MADLRIFIPLTKVDEAKRLVYGTLASEEPDRSGEILDFVSSVPHFRKWSEGIAETTNGKSLGNVREMHANKAVGKLVGIAFDEDAKKIDVCAKVVDDGAWQKCREGILTGFSVGGHYVKRWTDPNDPNLRRYTADPTEASLVDLPCVPSATFSLIKADGATEQRPFKSGAEPESAPAPTSPPHTSAGVRQRRLAGDDSEHLTKAAAMARNATIAAEKAEKTMDAALASKDVAREGDAPAGLQPAGLTRGDGSKPSGGVDYADPGYQADKKKRYPIDTEAHIRAAWNYIHKPRNSKKYSAEHLAAIKRRIVAAWKAKIDKHGPPEAEDGLSSPERSSGSAQAGKKAAEAEARKHLGDTGQVASTIIELKALKERLAIEAEIEDDDSPQPQHMQAIIEELCAFLQALVAEETEEIVNDKEAPRCATMGPDKAEAGAGLAKLEADIATLTQAVGRLGERVQKGAETLAALTAERDELKTRLVRVEAEPLPPKTIKLPPGITAVEKQGSGSSPSTSSGQEADLTAELQKLSPEEIQLLLIKAARRHPMRPVFAGPER